MGLAIIIQYSFVTEVRRSSRLSPSLKTWSQISYSALPYSYKNPAKGLYYVGNQAEQKLCEI